MFWKQITFLLVLFHVSTTKNLVENGDIWSGESVFINRLTENVEGSGEEEFVPTTVAPAFKQDSSIKGIPTVFPKLPKAPSTISRSNTREYRRKQATKSEYATLGNHRQTFVGSVLDFLGFRAPEIEQKPQSQLDDTLMRLFYDNSRDYRPVQPTQQLSRANPVAFQCANGIEAAQSFNITKFMGQWYQVMYSDNNANLNHCRMMSYRLLNLIDFDRTYIGSTFETLEYSTDGTPFSPPQMHSGFGMVNQPGEIYFRTSRGNFNVNIIHTGPENVFEFYQYVILAVDCYYPIYVFARDPMVFQQRYEQQVIQVMKNKQLINDFSRALNFVKTVDFTTCLIPPNFFSPN
uniref:Uncharacterized protein n=1 Tax=Panagrolaimus sp. JU765 TaxID=591449 RepID=A0AC34QJR9_9BILA